MYNLHSKEHSEKIKTALRLKKNLGIKLGRPARYVDAGKLQHFRVKGYSIRALASLFQVDKQTICNRLKHPDEKRQEYCRCCHRVMLHRSPQKFGVCVECLVIMNKISKEVATNEQVTMLVNLKQEINNHEKNK